MGPKGAKLVDFEVFEASFADLSADLKPLHKTHPVLITPRDATTTAAQLWNLVAKLNVSATNARLVAGTKTLHHLLPEVTPPIDRQYTAQFFYGPSGKGLSMGEEVAFMEMFPWLAFIAHEREQVINRLLADDTSTMATSFTKLIDNALVGFVLDQPTTVTS